MRHFMVKTIKGDVLFTVEPNKGDVFILALVGRGKTRAGYCSSGEDDGEAFIQDLEVNPEWRNVGIGEQLVRETLRSFRELGYTRASTNVLKTNDKAQRLLMRCGGKLGVSAIPNYDRFSFDFKPARRQAKPKKKTPR